MRRRHSLFAATTTALMLVASVAAAQPVQIFDEAPPLEVLRSIIIPESNGGMSRSIVIPRPDAPAQQSSAQRAVTVAVPATHTASPFAAGAATPVTQRATPVAAESRTAPDQSAEAAIVGFRINFAFDSDVLPHSAFDFVDRIAELMKEAPQLKLRVEGHTDAVGTPGYNLDLSKRRALSVAEYLVDHRGIAPERFILVGKGMNEPLVEDGSDPRNRRVQFARLI